MRAAKTGTYYEDEIISGYPCSLWISIFEDTYAMDGFGGYRFYGWPDGQPLMEQESCLVDIFKVIRSEWRKDMTDG